MTVAKVTPKPYIVATINMIFFELRVYSNGLIERDRGYGWKKFGKTHNIEDYVKRNSGGDLLQEFSNKFCDVFKAIDFRKQAMAIFVDNLNNVDKMLEVLQNHNFYCNLNDCRELADSYHKLYRKATKESNVFV